MKTVKFYFQIIAGTFLLLSLLWNCDREKPETPKIDLAVPVVTAEFDGENVILKWAPVNNAISYKVEYREEQSVDFHSAGTPSYSPFSISGLDFGKKYFFRVKAVNGDVESEWSALVSVDVQRYLPKPLARVNAGIGFIEVAWDEIEGAASYSVEHKLSVSSEWTVDYTGDACEFRITEVESGVSYDIRVGAVAEGYSMSYSDIVTTTTSQAPSTIITTGEQLAAWLSSISVETTDVAAIANDIDMQGISIKSASGFAGTLEGQGFAIKNLTSSVPLFAQNSGTIKDVVLDESCLFTAGSNIFGPLVGEGVGGSYKNVVNKASVSYKATADVTDPVMLGGIVGLSYGGIYENCSNWGAVTFDATGYSHKATSIGGIVGLLNNSEVGGSFYVCINYGPLTLQALYGDPNSKFNESLEVKGINMGGILGSCVYGEGRISFDGCENATSGTITFRHAEIDRLEKVEDSTGPIGIGGIMGLGDRASFSKCRNYALIDAKAKVSDPDVFTENESSAKKRRNYLLCIGGISGYGWDASGGHESCVNEGNIEVDYDGLFSNDDKWRAVVGGICGKGDRSSTDSYAYYCKQRGDITVTGRGVMSVGGIFGQNGKQIENTVEASCHITVNGLKGDVGGLVGYVEGGSANYTIRGCKCYATIFADSIWGEFEKAHYYTIGGLMGRWAGAQTGGNPSLDHYNGDPCVFGGSVSSVYQNTRVGFIMGYSDGDGKTKVYASQGHPILASGTFARKELETTTITADNIQEYAIGQVKGSTTMYVQYGE